MTTPTELLAQAEALLTDLKAIHPATIIMVPLAEIEGDDGERVTAAQKIPIGEYCQRAATIITAYQQLVHRMLEEQAPTGAKEK